MRVLVIPAVFVCAAIVGCASREPRPSSDELLRRAQSQSSPVAREAATGSRIAGSNERMIRFIAGGAGSGLRLDTVEATGQDR